jgi:hypothetical protein
MDLQRIRVPDADPTRRKQHLSMIEVLNRFEAYILSWGEDCAGWYCGITTEPEKVQREFVGGAWLCYEMNSELEARQLEISLRNNCGCEGVPNLGGRDARYIYVYLSAPQGLH